MAIPENMTEFQDAFNFALSGMLVMAVRPGMTESEGEQIESLSRAVAATVADRVQGPADATFVLMLAAARLLAPLVEMKPGGRYGGDASEGIRYFADWLDQNRPAQG